MPQSAALPNLTGSVVDSGRLRLHSLVGSGAYGKIYKAERTSSSTICAVKCLRRPKHSRRDAKFQQREATLHQLASAHENVLTMHSTFQDRDHNYFVFDYIAGRDMYRAILNGRYRRNADLVRRVFAGIVEGIRYCHSQGVYHRDLKPENILVDIAGGNPRIADFGLATHDPVSDDFDCGSPAYMSPESFNVTYTVSYRPRDSDAWALAIILINMVTEMNPWTRPIRTDPRWVSYLSDPLNFLREIVPISTHLNELLVCALDPLPVRRPSLLEVRNEVLGMTELYMSPEELRTAPSAVQRAAGVAGLVCDESDCSSASASVAVRQLVRIPAPASPPRAEPQSHLSVAKAPRRASTPRSDCSTPQELIVEFPLMPAPSPSASSLSSSIPQPQVAWCQEDLDWEFRQDEKRQRSKLRKLMDKVGSVFRKKEEVTAPKDLAVC
ncbi:unnamed protein product [Mycena citricolor]|uniref:Protein kinase domain-containing protein n=1 Tax=Mycena citricolor TaxID=2018698 RepID=A0AAD2GVZ2_9AGAR|nr:unnamed protein product [Mycena citricolor]CAK5263207.1 unnamed protein product [Mycena citricolor]